MFGRKRTVPVALGVVAVALCSPGMAFATTVTLGDASVPSHFAIGMGCNCTLAESFLPTPELAFAPGPGLITSWRLAGLGTVKLSVLESSSAPEGWINVATSAPAANVEGQPNATNLQIGFDDMIAVTFERPQGGDVGESEANNDQVFLFRPELPVNVAPREPETTLANKRLEFGAEEVLAPVLSALSPASGAATGGNAVKITGKYLDGATQVTFGSAPASSFSVDSPTAITAIAPPSAASTVDVRVSGPGGSSEVTGADHYTFTGAGTPGGGPTPVGPAATKLVLAGFRQSASRWKRGGSSPRISSAPVGTTFTFSVNEPATARLLFSRQAPGRKVKGQCIPSTSANRSKPRCKRTLSAGALSFSAHAGANKVRFQGRLSGNTRLTAGNYSVAILVRDSRHQAALSPSLSFTIISG